MSRGNYPGGVAANHHREPPLPAQFQAAADCRVEDFQARLGSFSRDAANDVGTDGVELHVNVAVRAARNWAARLQPRWSRWFKRRIPNRRPTVRERARLGPPGGTYPLAHGRAHDGPNPAWDNIEEQVHPFTPASHNDLREAVVRLPVVDSIRKRTVRSRPAANFASDSRVVTTGIRCRLRRSNEPRIEVDRHRLRWQGVGGTSILEQSLNENPIEVRSRRQQVFNDYQGIQRRLRNSLIHPLQNKIAG